MVVPTVSQSLVPILNHTELFLFIKFDRFRIGTQNYILNSKELTLKLVGNTDCEPYQLCSYALAFIVLIDSQFRNLKGRINYLCSIVICPH